MSTPRRQMPRRIYPLRMLGMGLGGMVVGVVLWERQASLYAWAGMVLLAFVWPHVAYLRTRYSADPYRTEINNLLVDSAMAAAFVPLMHFNLLPSVLVVTLTMVDKITTGIRRLWAHALWAILAGGSVCALLMGVHWAPETSMRVMIACLPVMVLHTLSVSMVSYQLIRKTARQNQMLDELRRMDALTGLFGRGHWQEQAEAALRRHHTTDEPACMLMLDIDRFKEINDTHGHTVGDEVIRALAHVVRGNVRAGDCAGRYGGDEFAIVLPGMHAKDALAIAHRIREQTEGVRLRSLPGIRITSSIGVAPADHRHSSLRAWIDAADTALYTAKNGGRNQVAGCMEPALLPAV
ncbi:sensor domain-containing diguanylate cyclase [Acidovorax radicis]|uniref:GGDEF domain-containing protein n=1 Tax=Acidovorax radicis TaxID=758826 RepID=UPI001CF89DA9|nr:GGDEF domain-containing protein [Acidovorax radicis]UCU98636.1 diguanylate cyclase AdrA [Acidovorax radicis]